jgi:hypothetical protein
MRAQLAVDVVVIALTEEMQVELGELWGEVIRVVLLEGRAVAIADAQPVRLQRSSARHLALEQAGLVDAAQRRGVRAAVGPLDDDLGRVGLEHAHDRARLGAAAPHLVIAEQRARLGMTRLDERADLRVGQPESARHRCSLAARDDKPRLRRG